MLNDTTPWPANHLALVQDESKSVAEIARLTGRTAKSVKSKRYRLRKNAKKAAAAPAKKAPTALPNHLEDKTEKDNSYWHDRYKILDREYQKSLKQNVLIDRLIADIKEIAPLSYTPAPKQLLGPAIKNQTPESAVLLFSDTHVGKVVRSAQTLGFSEYNFAIFLARLKYLENRVISILRGHTTAPIAELVIAMLGDMLDGALAHGSEGGLRNVVFNQFYAAGHAIAQFFRNLAAVVPTLRIVTTVGNHTRWGTQKKMPTENRYSNFDHFLYAYIQALTKDIPNIKWTLDEQPFSIFKVQGWTFFGSHGDNLKGGDAAFGIPVHSVARQVNTTTQLFYKHGAEVPHYFVCGHHHRAIQLPTGLGDVTVNGAFPGLDNYALDGNFNPVDPAQVFFRVHPKYGKVAEYKLQLKHADVSKPTYELPAGFMCE